MERKASSSGVPISRIMLDIGVCKGKNCTITAMTSKIFLKIIDIMQNNC